MSALPAIHRLFAFGLPLPREAYVPGPSHYHRCLQYVRELWIRGGCLRYKNPVIYNYNYSSNYLIVDQFILFRDFVGYPLVVSS